MKIKFDNPNKEEYNKEPVFYCRHCLSLKIIGVPDIEDLNYCDECGATEVEQTDINEWEQMYEKKYGFNFIKNN